MKLNETNKTKNKIKFSIEEKDAIPTLIDIKIENDMKEIINQFKISDTISNTKFDSLKNQIKTIYWVVGLAMTLLLAVIALKK